MTSKNTKSSEELKSEVSEQLGKVETDIDQIQKRMTPGQLIDDAIFYPRGANIGSTIDLMKNNPVGATFLTLGTLLLMEDDHHKSYEQIAKSQVKDKLGAARDQLGTMASDAREQLHNVTSQTKEKVEDLKSKVQDKLPDTNSFDAKETLKSASENVSSHIEEGIQTVKELDPMVYAAVGAGLGALTGLSLPTTDAEEHMADGKIEEMASTFTHELQEALNESAAILKDLVASDLKSINLEVFPHIKASAKS